MCILGASPLTAMEACSHAAKGRDVVLWDESKRPGGSWGRKRLRDGTWTEKSPHIINPAPRSYECLQAAGFAMELMEPQPKIAYRLRSKWCIVRYPSSSKWAEFLGKKEPLLLPNHFLIHTLEKYRKNLLKVMRFRGGARRVEGQILKLVEKFSLKTVFSQKMERIRRDAGKWVIEEKSREMAFDRVMVTSNTTNIRVERPDGEQTVVGRSSKKGREFHQLYLVFDEALVTSEYSYVLIATDPHLKAFELVPDDKNRKGKVVICCWFHDSTVCDDKTVRRALEALVELGAIVEDSPVHTEWTTFKSPYAKALSTRAKGLEFFDTRDFGDCLSKNSRRWMKVFES